MGARKWKVRTKQTARKTNQAQKPQKNCYRDADNTTSIKRPDGTTKQPKPFLSATETDLDRPPTAGATVTDSTYGSYTQNNPGPGRLDPKPTPPFKGPETGPIRTPNQLSNSNVSLILAKQDKIRYSPSPINRGPMSLQKLPFKFGGYRRYKALYDDLNDIVWNSWTEESFEDNWVDFIDDYNLHNNTWLSDLYDDRRMWVPIYFKGEFWAAMRSTQRSESMHAFYGGYLHSKTSLVQFVNEYDNVLGVKEHRELKDDAADSRGLSLVQRHRLWKNSFSNNEHGPLVYVKVEEEILVNDTILCIPYDVQYDPSTQQVRCECNLFESSGVLCCHCLEVFHSYNVYKVPTCYVLPRWSKIIKRKHTDDDKTALLHAALEETRAKLDAHRAKKRSESVFEPDTSNGSQSSNIVGVDDIQAPSKVTTKGRPKGKRLGTALEKSFKNSTRRKHKNSSPVVYSHASQDVNHGSVVGRNVPEQAGGFMSLLNSFNKK
ncbi:hypothetical protein AHAS_Ahas13G0205300 [Arachis hypogaea]